jgi:hypothetical protein
MAKSILSQGTSPRDMWRWQRAGWCERVHDPREGQSFCHRCGEPVRNVLVCGRWQVRGLDNLPHKLVCSGRRKPRARRNPF